MSVLWVISCVSNLALIVFNTKRFQSELIRYLKDIFAGATTAVEKAAIVGP
jgi:hypothetical protein